jgi:hypothetical protein
VVPVLITSCHVSLKPNSGPLSAHTMITTTASEKTDGLPQKYAVCFANLEYQLPLCITCS